MPSSLRRLVLLAIGLWIAPAARAQVVFDEGVAPLVPVDAYVRPADDGVWTDMRPLAFKGSDEELQAATGATLYAGPAPGTLSVEAWHGRFATAGRVDCATEATVCAVRVVGEGSREAWLFPFGAEPLGVPPGTRMRVVPRLRLTASQLVGLGEGSLQGRGLVLGDGNTLSSGAAGTSLLTTQPGASDCGAPGVSCGVVFEVETTGAYRGEVGVSLL